MTPLACGWPKPRTTPPPPPLFPLWPLAVFALVYAALVALAYS